MAGVAVYAVVYPAALRFLEEFWQSLEPQLAEGFELCLSLDGVSDAQVRDVAGWDRSIRLMPAVVGGSPSSGTPSPAEIRDVALTRLTEEYSAVILLDVDDVLLPGRLEAARSALSGHDVYASALQIVDEANEALPVSAFTLDPAQMRELTHGTLLARVNAIGFSNSAYRSETLRACLGVPAGTVLVDWLVASRAYLLGASFTFDSVPRMRYRQYGRNTASVLPPFSSERVLTDARRVVEHYRLLLSTTYGTRRSVEPFRRAQVRAEEFHAWLQRSGPYGRRNVDEYAKALSALPQRTYLWWEHVAMDLPGLDFQETTATRKETWDS